MGAPVLRPPPCCLLYLREANIPHFFEFHDPNDVEKKYGNDPNSWPTAALMQQMHQEFLTFFDQGDSSMSL
jgi:hypothetical protein